MHPPPAIFPDADGPFAKSRKSGMTSKQGTLLVNLGSPKSPARQDVRRYLGEFLMDKRVMDLPFLVRWLIVHLGILPFRSAKTAEAYHKIWGPEGSPLIAISQRVCAALQQRVPGPVALAMRYQNPSIDDALKTLVSQGIDQLQLIPLYPQYALSSYETVVVRVREAVGRIAPRVALDVTPPFFDDPDYLAALVASAAAFLQRDFNRLLFSFHGLPERHLRKTDPTGRHCLRTANCCLIASPVHRTCYRAQAFRIVEGFVKRAGIPSGKYSIAFQSRLGRSPWLQPFTDQELARLPAAGIKRLLVICPAFVTDCLETLEEIDQRGRAIFLGAGGREFTYIPCLNEHPRWLKTLENWISRRSDAG